MLSYIARLLADRGDAPGGPYLFLDEPLVPSIERSGLFCTDNLLHVPFAVQAKAQ